MTRCRSRSSGVAVKTRAWPWLVPWAVRVNFQVLGPMGRRTSSPRKYQRAAIVPSESAARAAAVITHRVVRDMYRCLSRGPVSRQRGVNHRVTEDTEKAEGEFLFFSVPSVTLRLAHSSGVV